MVPVPFAPTAVSETLNSARSSVNSRSSDSQKAKQPGKRVVASSLPSIESQSASREVGRALELSAQQEVENTSETHRNDSPAESARSDISSGPLSSQSHADSLKNVGASFKGESQDEQINVNVGTFLSHGGRTPGTEPSSHLHPQRTGEPTIASTEAEPSSSDRLPQSDDDDISLREVVQPVVVLASLNTGSHGTRNRGTPATSLQ